MIYLNPLYRFQIGKFTVEKYIYGTKIKLDEEIVWEGRMELTMNEILDRISVYEKKVKE